MALEKIMFWIHNNKTTIKVSSLILFLISLNIVFIIYIISLLDKPINAKVIIGNPKEVQKPKKKIETPIIQRGDTITEIQRYKIPSSKQYTFEGIMDSIITIESNNKTNAVSRSGNHFGLCQLSDVVGKKVSAQIGIKWKRTKNSYTEQKRLCSRRLLNMVKALKKAELPITASNIYLLHQQGINGGKQLIRAVETNSFEDLVSRRKNLGSNIPTALLIKTWYKYYEEKL